MVVAVVQATAGMVVPDRPMMLRPPLDMVREAGLAAQAVVVARLAKMGQAES
jgi:hypothetical protein